MVLMQQSKEQQPKVEAMRKLFAERVGDKHEPVMGKLGAIVASGIIDAGGRNCAVALTSRSGHKRPPAIAALLIFTQHWYWYPYFHFFSLSTTPTAIIGVTHTLEMPVFRFTSHARPSLFAYPPETKEPEKKVGKKVSTAVLSYTKKKRSQATRSLKNSMMVSSDDLKAMEIVDEAEKEAREAAEKAEEEKRQAAEQAKVEEPTSEVLSNPHRVTYQQRGHIHFDVDERYEPVISGNVHGIVLLRDRSPDQPVKYVTASSGDSTAEGDGADGEEAPVPEGEWVFDPAQE